MRHHFPPTLIASFHLEVLFSLFLTLSLFMTIFIETKVLSNIIATYFLFSISVSSLPYNYTSSINNRVINFSLLLAEFERHVRGDIAILNCSGERESPRKIPLLIATSPIVSLSAVSWVFHIFILSLRINLMFSAAPTLLVSPLSTNLGTKSYAFL